MKKISNNKIFLIFLFVFVFIFVLYFISSRINLSKKVSPKEINQIAQNIYLQFNPNYPGRGLSDYPSDKEVDVPKSYAMILIAELMRKEKGINPNLPSLHKKVGYWLLNNANLSPEEEIGWGVPVAWDAFSDGSVNPANTIYTISNAIVMHALLDWLEKSPSDAPKFRIYKTLDEMIKPYLNNSIRTPSKLLPYSLLACDRPYDTYNPAAYFAGQLQRYSTIIYKKDRNYAKKLEEIADQTMQVLLSHHKTDRNGRWYWFYSAQEPTPNDLPHASYIILGIKNYIDYNGNLAKKFDWNAIISHLKSFDRNGSTLFGWPDFTGNIVLPARLYDVGIALYLSCSELNKQTIKSELLQSVKQYKNKNGKFQKYPVNSNLDNSFGNRVVGEYVSYLYLGLLSCSKDNN